MMRDRSSLCSNFIRLTPLIFIKNHTVQVNQIVKTSLKFGNSKAGAKILIKEIQQDLWGGQATIFGVRVLSNGQFSHTVECQESDILSHN